MSYKHIEKNKGDLIVSSEWNSMGSEIERIEADKVDRKGDAIKGDLKITGNVGIGTDKPVAQLHISKKDSEGNAYNQISIGSSPDDGKGGSTELNFVGHGPGDGAYIDYSRNSNRKLTFRNIETDAQGNESGHKHVMTLDHVGNVGIGTTTPSAKLEVKGDIKADNFYKLLPPNLVSNSYMNQLEGNIPKGFTTGTYAEGGTITIEAVHPFTKGFEGPYINEAECKKCTASVDEATKDNPHCFGTYNKGQRAARGGLADGWGSIPGGNILKITGKRNAGANSNVFLKLPKADRTLTRKVLIRAWIKIVKGSVTFKTDQGVNPNQITKKMTQAAPDGWYFMNKIIEGSHVVSLNVEHVFNFFFYGEDKDYAGDFEAYIALPYIANIEKEDDPHWAPSILDTLSDYGITRDLNTGNVGIGGSVDTAKPIMGKWYPSAHGPNTTGNQNIYVIFDQASDVTDSSYFTNLGDDKGIKIEKEGYYYIEFVGVVSVSPEDYAESYLQLNWSYIDVDYSHAGTGWKHRRCSWKGKVFAGSIIRVNIYHYKATPYWYHCGPCCTRLTIHKMT